MAHPWPMAPEGGSATSETDLQRIVGAQYMNKGILPNGGGTVSGRSDMSYLVRSAAVFLWTDRTARLGVLVPVEQITIPTEAAPPTGSRTDTIYVGLDGVPRVTAGSPPSTSVTLGKFVIPAGTTSTSSAQKAIDREFAIPVGAGLEGMPSWEAPSGTNLTSESRVILYSEQFQVPTDRRIRIDLTATLHGLGGSNSHVGFGISIVNGFTRALSCDLGSSWRTYSGTWTTEVSAGTHTINVWYQVNLGPGGQTAGASTTSQMNLWDAGVVR